MRSRLPWVICPGCSPCRPGACRPVATQQREHQRRAGEFAPPTAAPDDAQKGGELTVLCGRRRRLHRPGRRLLPAHLHGDGGDPARPARRGSRTTPGPDTRLAPRANRRYPSDDKTVTFKIRGPGSSTARRWNREATSRPTSSTRSSAACCPAWRMATTVYLGAHRGLRSGPRRPRQDPTTAPDMRGIETPDDQTIVFNLTSTGRRWSCRRCRCRSARRSGGVREEVRRGEPLDLRGAPGCDRPVHDRERRRGGEVTDETRGQRPTTSPARRSPWSVTRTGIRSTDWRPAYLDTIDFAGGLQRHGVGVAEDPHRRSDQVNGDFAPPARG